ncbi:hypothetical protein TWF694_004555 [Orbilia ellipsospora]|uniref:Uncharacterized protein n=1 Tax=Orbilia ellipsospora TaxID=2528407 RepID=A0AAV9WVG3_9PEZI
MIPARDIPSYLGVLLPVLPMVFSQFENTTTTTIFSIVANPSTVTSTIIPLCNQVTWAALSSVSSSSSTSLLSTISTTIISTIPTPSTTSTASTTSTTPTTPTSTTGTIVISVSSAPNPSITAGDFDGDENTAFVLQGTGVYDQLYLELDPTTSQLLLAAYGQYPLLPLSLTSSATSNGTLQNANNANQILYVTYDSSVVATFPDEDPTVLTVIRAVKYGSPVGLTEDDWTLEWFWNETTSQVQLLHEGQVWSFYTTISPTSEDADGDTYALYMYPDSINLSSDVYFMAVDFEADLAGDYPSSAFSTVASTSTSTSSSTSTSKTSSTSSSTSSTSTSTSTTTTTTSTSTSSKTMFVSPTNAAGPTKK